MKWLKITEKLTNNNYHNNLEHILEKDITDYISKSNIRMARMTCILVGNDILNILINKKPHQRPQHGRTRAKIPAFRSSLLFVQLSFFYLDKRVNF